MEEQLIKLRCVKEQGKLRIKIISPGYNPYANCQFPRNIRVEGREYTVYSTDIKFSESGYHKFFYRISKANVKIITDDIDSTSLPEDINSIKIYEDERDVECCICMTNEKDVIFYPCGHYNCCGTCANILMIQEQPCPICRAKIIKIVGREELQ